MNSSFSVGVGFSPNVFFNDSWYIVQGFILLTIDPYMCDDIAVSLLSQLCSFIREISWRLVSPIYFMLQGQWN